MNVYELAGEAYDCFETAERTDGESYIRVKDGSPEWVTGLVYAAHGEFLPDDWRYKSIRSALAFIHDNEPADVEDAGEFADGNVDVYNSARSAWLASDLRRADYCDKAAERFGITETGHGRGVFDFLALGQYAESEEVYGAVVEALQERAEEED